MCTIAQRARQMGRHARILRMGVGDCPFVFGDPDTFHWIAGWCEEDLEALESVRALEAQSNRERCKR